MENKYEGNENKTILGNFICTMDEMEMNDRNKTLYKYNFNYALSKFILDNGLKDLGRRENPDSSEFTRYNRSSGTRSATERVYTDIKMANITKVNYIMICFIDQCNAIFIDRLPSKLKLEKVHGTLIILLYVSLSSP